MNRSQSYEFAAKSVEDAVDDGLRQLGLSREQIDVEVVEEGSRGILGIGATDALVRITPRKKPEGDEIQIGERSAASESVVSERRDASYDLADSDSAVAEPETQLSDDGEAERARAVEVQVEAGEQTNGDAELEDLAYDLLSQMLRRLDIEAEIELSWPDDEEDGESPLNLNVVGEDLGILIGRNGETLSSIQYLIRLMVNQELHRWKNIVIDVTGAGWIQFVGRPRRDRDCLDFAAGSSVDSAAVSVLGEYNKRSILQKLVDKLELAVDVLNRQDEHVKMGQDIRHRGPRRRKHSALAVPTAHPALGHGRDYCIGCENGGYLWQYFIRKWTKQRDMRRPELRRTITRRDWRRRGVTVLYASFWRIQVGESGCPFGRKHMNGSDLMQDRQVDVFSGAGEDSRIVPQSSRRNCGEADGAAQDVVHTRGIGGFNVPGDGPYRKKIDRH